MKDLACRLNEETIKKEYLIPGQPELIVTYSHTKIYYRPIKTSPGKTIHYEHNDLPQINEQVEVQKLDSNHVSERVIIYIKESFINSRTCLSSEPNPKGVPEELTKRLSQLPSNICEVINSVNQHYTVNDKLTSKKP